MTGATQQQGEKGSCTSPSSPALKIAEGNIASVDLNQRFFTLEDRAGIIFIRIEWKANEKIDAKMAKQKPGYYQKPLYLEMNGKNILEDLPWADRPADFPRPQHTQQGGNRSGGRPYVPRNEKIIVAQCLLKAYVDLWPNCHTPDTVSFADAREEILKAVEADIGRVMKAGGA